MSGVVKSLKLRSADDEDVCEACRHMSGRIFPIETNEQISFVMENAAVAKPVADATGAPKKFCEAEPVMRRKEGREG